MFNLLLVGLGGAIGSILRQLLNSSVQKLTGTEAHWTKFPLGILLVNVLGCLVIGFLATVLNRQGLHRAEQYRLLLVVGVLGGFTTFSSYAADTLRLVNEREMIFALGNILLSNTFGLAAAWVGFRAAMLLAAT